MDMLPLEAFIRKFYHLRAATRVFIRVDSCSFVAHEFFLGRANSNNSCLGTPGSKQRRQRASYMPPAPTTIRSSDSTRRCVCLAGFPQRMQIAKVFLIDSASVRRIGMGAKGPPIS